MEHAAPQPPQWSGLLAVLISQPSVRRLPLQSAKPAVQVEMQEPAAQAGVTTPCAEQAAPQEHVRFHPFADL